MIVDSSRNDDAVRLIAQSSSVPNHYHWTEPEGIYSAMNIGLRFARGDYVWFVNAGDEVSPHLEIRNLLEALTDNNPAWLIGQVAFIREKGKRITPAPFDYAAEYGRSFARGKFPPHQGTIVRKALLQDLGGFDPKYTIAADYHVALRIACMQAPLLYAGEIAEFTTGGVSSTEWRACLEEFKAARREVLSLQGSKRAQEQLDSRILFLRMGLARLLGRT